MGRPRKNPLPEGTEPKTAKAPKQPKEPKAPKAPKATKSSLPPKESKVTKQEAPAQIPRPPRMRAPNGTYIAYAPAVQRPVSTFSEFISKIAPL